RDPVDFRGIKWGTNIDTLSGFTHIGTEKSSNGSGDLDEYRRDDDVLSIGNANVEKIIYQFWQGKFYGVKIIYKDWDPIFRELIAKFGRSYATENEIKSRYRVNTVLRARYVWYGERANVVAQYGDHTCPCIWITSLKVSEEREKTSRSE
ncbi:MAG: hypothetical protein GWN20_24740, partial [Phycisphaerae bacterium]|nr:hypothetical protein [Phycisphaerae bacterium]